MNEYQKEQLDALRTVRFYLEKMNEFDRTDLRKMMSEYLVFRKETDRFLGIFLSEICSETCYRNRLSACCSKDGIITFFADVVINALHSSPADLARLEKRLLQPNSGTKCVYLSQEGCLWKIKPIVCQMFLCDRAQKVLDADAAAAGQWESLLEKKKRFTWPDQPVLFDRIEQLFMAAGHLSSLMYLNNSPGLLMVKRRAGLVAV